jgi:hypothetical protein
MRGAEVLFVLKEANDLMANNPLTWNFFVMPFVFASVRQELLQIQVYGKESYRF